MGHNAKAASVCGHVVTAFAYNASSNTVQMTKLIHTAVVACVIVLELVVRTINWYANGALDLAQLIHFVRDHVMFVIE